MYEKYYGLKEKPFSLTPDPGYLFFSEKHREALAHLEYGIKERQGFILITGEVGTGKTTICRALLNRIDQRVRTSLILNPRLSGFQLLQAIVEDFGVAPETRSRRKLFQQLNSFLLAQSSSGVTPVLILDEAQGLAPDLLEEIRIVSNMETEKSKLLQIILVGQPELRDKINSPSLRQLRQRIAIRYHILPLDRGETSAYIEHRLRVAGADDGVCFHPLATDRIFAYSAGIPRLINLVCDKSLLAGFVRETKCITDDLAETAIRELEAGMLL